MVLVMMINPVAFPQQRDLRFRCGGSGVRSSEGSGNQGVARDSRPVLGIPSSRVQEITHGPEYNPPWKCGCVDYGSFSNAYVWGKYVYNIYIYYTIPMYMFIYIYYTCIVYTCIIRNVYAIVTIWWLCVSTRTHVQFCMYRNTSNYVYTCNLHTQYIRVYIYCNHLNYNMIWKPPSLS
jgi:hypothetical protein